jgi:hypothetical protein
MIPPFEDSGNLPPGIHWALWPEIQVRFGSTRHRRRLLRGLYSGATSLKQAHCSTLWIDGSFVAAKERPSDFDACWDTTGVDPDLLDPVILDVDYPRYSQKVKFGGEFLPNVSVGGKPPLFLDFFQEDKETGLAKGIVALDLRRFRP